ncbi:MAG: coproporphyrinogen-III oxidase family protein [Coriobacteriales bacterium]|nr:coproporphyrinogen-III oxidase family protein [Coriobacteriales bacterium]
MSADWRWREVSGSAGALYVHVPFCVRKCVYCDFASWATDAADGRITRYVHSLRRQLDELAECGLLEACRTGYVGGGTPSMLGADTLSGLVRHMRACALGMQELTCEANPDSLTAEVLAAVEAGGATRLSVGVQSLADVELATLGRLHNARQAKESVRAAVATGLDVSTDLMCAIPHQTDATWAATLSEACDLGVGHLSVYPLTLEPNTPLGDRHANDDPAWNDEEVQARRMEAAQEALRKAGFVRYEVASYAREGRRCLHNMAYWTGVPYIGVGHGAASMLDRGAYHKLRTRAPQLPRLESWVERVRLRVESPWERIARAPSVCDMEFSGELLTAEQAMAEDLMLGMRLVWGIDECLIAEAASIFGKDLERTVGRLEEEGLVRLDAGGMVPTNKGWLLGNEVFGALWSLAPAEVAQLS